MEILPIKLITQEDQEIFGADNFNLAKLVRTGFPVAKGYALTPPDIQLNTVLKNFDYKNREVFEQSFTLMKRQINEIPEPEEFKKAFEKGKNFYISGNQVKGVKNLWTHLLNSWLDQLRHRIWNEGFASSLNKILTPQTVFILDNVQAEIKSFFDPDTKDVVIESKDKLNPKILQAVDELTISANKKLFLPQVYRFILTKGRVELVDVKPFTQTLPGSVIPQVVISKTEQKRIVKSAVKVFLNLSSGFAIEKNIDGILIESDYALDVDSLIFKIAESALTFPHQTVIFKLPDDSEHEVRGCLKLVHQSKMLNQLAEIILFIRNKKSLYNIKVGIPYVRSALEYLQLKRELAVRGIIRKGSFGFWLEFAVPENLINLEEYLVAGFDGAIINLDSLWSLLGGAESGVVVFYKNEVNTLAKFLKAPIKALHKAKIPILITGQLSLHPDILDFLVEAGIWGVVANSNIEAESLPEHLNWTEKRMLFKKLSVL